MNLSRLNGYVVEGAFYRLTVAAATFDLWPGYDEQSVSYVSREEE